MRTLLFAAYFMGAGYLICAMDLDEDMVQVARGAYRAVIRHTVEVADERRRELAALDHGQAAAVSA